LPAVVAAARLPLETVGGTRVIIQTLVLDFDQTVRDHVALELNPDYIVAKKKEG
jgi:hypothetical protein